MGISIRPKELTYSSISVGDTVFDIIKYDKVPIIRLTRCITVTNSEITLMVVSDPAVVSYSAALFNKQFFVQYEKALELRNEDKLG